MNKHLHIPKKYIFADMDGTITHARTRVGKAMTELLTLAEQKLPLVVLSGAPRSRMLGQLSGLTCDVLGQCGNESEFWNHMLTDAEYHEISQHIDLLKGYFGIEPRAGMTYVEHRGSLVNYSVVGCNAAMDIKNAFDPDFSKRKQALEAHPFKNEGLEVKYGGTTSYDYTQKGRNKGTNVKAYIDMKGWNPEECIYLGDGVFEGGNDSTVIGVIDAVRVHTLEDTFNVIADIVRHHLPGVPLPTWDESDKDTLETFTKT